MKKSLLILVFLMLCSPMATIAVYGQTLVYSIFVPHRVDRKRGITVKISLRNVSDRPIVIEKRSVNYSVSFTKYGAGYDISSGDLTITGDSTWTSDDELMVLKPNEMFAAERALNLNDKFFERKREYTVRLKYGQFRHIELNNMKAWRGTIESNEAKFKIR